MRKITAVPFIFILLSLLIACGDDDIARVSKAIEEVGEEYAPDSRTAIYDIKLRSRREGIILAGRTTEREAVEILKERLDSMGYDLLDEIVLLPDTSVKKPFAVVNVSVANLRSWHRHSNQLVTQALLGTPLRIVDKDEDEWFRVQTPEGYLGWVDDGAIVRMEEEEWNAWKESDLVTYTEPFGWVFTRPEEVSPRVSDVTAGAFLEKLGESEAWYEVQLPDGRKGYIRKRESMFPRDWPSMDSLRGESIVKTAYDYMGVPYLWGGTSPKGFDCSGYTKTVFAQYGVLLPRDASQQVKVGVELPLDSTLAAYQPGDLLFFGHVEDRNDELSFAERQELDRDEMRITHVAVYVGDGKIIHATGRVREQSLRPGDPDFAADRYDSFLQARRIVGAGEDDGVLRLEEKI